ncbi:AAA family ATPase [Candidatus Pacearchaeota archaeon]|nr:AAA family ATPase [Candidatus Pacearchaeota archaeon]
MKRLILIRGPICAGKSTTARALLENLEESSLVDQDSIKRAIDYRMSSDWRDKIAFDTTLYLANLLMKEKRDIIADIHSSIHGQYESYKKLASKNNYNLFSFLLYPPLEVCQQRSRIREIPDIKYKITDEDVERYWKNPHKVLGETVFDSSVIKTEGIVKIILEIIK